MKTSLLAPEPRRRQRRTQAFRFRAPTPAALPTTCVLLPNPATHDFLVPNPRPDLAMDPATLGMLDAGWPA